MKILVIGDAILDAYCYGQINRMSPEDPSIPVLDVVREENRLGGCLNVAANIKSLSDYKVDVSSVIPYECAALLSERDIGYTRHSFSVNASKSIKKTRFISIDEFKQLLRVDNRRKIDSEMLERYISFCGDYQWFDKFDCIVVSDYDKNVVSDKVVDKLKEFKKPVFVDTKKKDLSIWKDIENCFVKINRKEFNKSINCEFLKNVIITEGDYGATHLYYHNRIDAYMSNAGYLTEPVENPEVTGAGDVFLSGLVVEYMKSKDLPKAIEFANMVAGKSVQQQGTTEVRL